MILNYLVVLFRTLMRHKFQTAINVLGLTAAIAFTILIAMFVARELEVNNSLKDPNQLFMLRSKVRGDESPIDFFTPGLLSKAAAEQHPNIVDGYYRFWDRSITVSKDDKHFRIQSMIGDASFLQLFGFSVLHGDASNALKDPNTAIITESTARQYFNRTDVVNETVSISTERNGVKEYVINAVIADPDKKNTVTDLMNMNAQIFIGLENREDFFSETSPDSWKDMMIAYIRLTPGASKSDAAEILNNLLRKNAPQEISENRVIEISPLSDYYLLTNHGAVLKLVLSLTAIIAFILILAITNFINITIAGSFNRLKEVGIRKVIGSQKRQLIFQFLTESVLISSFSVAIALFLYQLLYPVFGAMLNAQLPSLADFKTTYWVWILALPFFIGVSAGLYPALFQSGLRPIESLKGKSKSVQGTISFSRLLIAVQFVITIFILIGSVVLSRQTNHFLEHDLGYNKSHVVIVNSVPRVFDETGFEKVEAAREVLAGSAGIESVSLSWGAPGWGIGGFENEIYKDGAGEANKRKAHLTGVDENFADVYGLRLISGVFLFQESSRLIRKSLVLNKSAAATLEATVGDRMRVVGSPDVFTVVGIVDDFHYESMHEAVKPLAFMHNRDYESYRFFSFRMEPGAASAIVTQVQTAWNTAFPDEPFSYYFADERLQALYSTELQLKKAANVASVLMMIIVMTGILGLVSLNLSKRNKEVGIRKALGATVPNILFMFSKEYVRLMLFSCVIGIPLAIYFAGLWLENFVYHINLTWWMFVLPAAALMAITVLLVGIQSYGTATTNPVKSLRYE